MAFSSNAGFKNGVRCEKISRSPTTARSNRAFESTRVVSGKEAVRVRTIRISAPPVDVVVPGQG